MLTDDWPRTMCYLFPPESHNSAAMDRAILESMKGTDVIFIAMENKVNRAFDKVVSRQIGIWYDLGSPLFHPYKERSENVYGIYIFLAPNTISRIYLKRTSQSCKTAFDALYKKSKEDFDKKYKETFFDIAARMHWSGFSVNQVQDRMEGKNYAKSLLKPYIAALSEKSGQAIPKHCIQ